MILETGLSIGSISLHHYDLAEKEDVPVLQMGETRKEHVSLLTKEEWHGGIEEVYR